MLQNRWESGDLTPWKSISKQVRKLTFNRVTVASKFTFLERNWKLRNVHYTGNKNCGFLFYFQIFFEVFLNSYSTVCLQTSTYLLLFSIIWSASMCDHFTGISMRLVSILESCRCRVSLLRLLPSVYHYKNNNVSVVGLIRLYT